MILDATGCGCRRARSTAGSPRGSPAGRAAARRRRGRGVARDPGMALAVAKELDGRARGRPSGDHALAGRLDPNDVERGRDRRRAGGGRLRRGGGPGADAGTAGSARRARLGSRSRQAAGGLRRPRVGPRPAPARPRRGSAAVRARAEDSEPDHHRAQASKPDAATAVGASREMAILIHTLSAALFGSLRRLCSKRPWRSGQSGAPGTCRDPAPALPCLASMSDLHSICVYCGSGLGADPVFAEAARRRSAAPWPRPASASSMAAAMSA